MFHVGKLEENSNYLTGDVVIFPKVGGATVFGHIFPSEEAREDEIFSYRKEKESYLVSPGLSPAWKVEKHLCSQRKLLLFPLRPATKDPRLGQDLGRCCPSREQKSL